MPTDVSRTRLSGLLVPNQSAAIWEAESSYSQAGPRPGVPAPANTTAAVLASSGTMIADASYDVLSSSGGFPGVDSKGARFVWKNTTDTSTQYRGWNVPQAISGWEAVLWTDASGDLKTIGQTHAVALADGTVVAVAQIRDDAFPTIDYRVEAIIRNVSTGVWGRVVVYTEGAAPGNDFCPALCVLPSGRILCYYATTNGTTTNIAMKYSDDKGATWTAGGSAVLDEDFTASGDEIRRIRAAYSNGQILMLVWWERAVDPYDRVSQYASSDLGNHFSSITTTSGFRGYPDIVVLPDGRFTMFYVVDIGGVYNFKTRTFGSAYFPYTDATAVNCTFAYSIANAGGGPFVFDSAGELTAVIDENGVIYVYVQAWTGKHGTMFASYDLAESWTSVGSAGLSTGSYGVWWDGTTSAADYPVRLCAVAWRGSVLMLHGWVASTGNEDSSLGCMVLGGYSSVTLPTIARFSSEDRYAAWEDNWLPIELPSDAGWTATGAGTAALTSPGHLELTAAAGDTIWYEFTPTATIAQGMIVRFRLAIPSGGSTTTNRIAVTLRNANATNGYHVDFRCQDAAWTLYDAESNTQIGSTQTIAMTGDGVEFIAAIVGSSVATWYRSATIGASKLWTAGPTTAALTDHAAATHTTNAIRFGIQAVGIASHTAKWYEMHHSAGAYSFASEWAAGVTNPTDLTGRNYASRPVYVDGGLALTMTDGPTFAGDSWVVATRYDYPLTNALDVTSPRQVWRSTDTTAQVITLRWDDSLDANAWPDRSLMGISLLNTNVSRFTIEFLYQDSPDAWYSFGTANTYDGLGNALRFTRDGNTVRPDATTNSTQMPYLKHGEMVGATFSYSATSSRRILRNSEGAWRNAASVRLRPIVVLDGAVGGDAASGTAGAIIPRDVTVLVDMVEFPYSAIRITIPTTVAGTHPPPAEAYYQIGSLVFGSVYAFGLDYSWGRTIDTEPGTEVTESRDRTRRTRVASPARRTVEVSWTDGADLTNVSADEADPDYILGSSDAKAEANASRHGTPTVLEGLIRELDGAHRPIVYLPRFAETSGVRILNRREEMVYGRIESPLRVEVVQGEELRDEVVRVAQIVIVEEV